jgi:predicted RNase H-like HicB family nuclease
MKQYPIQIHFVEEKEGDDYFFAFHPDFGHSACSATGDTVEEALASLGLVRIEVMRHYRETGKQIPEPSGLPGGLCED